MDKRTGRIRRIVQGAWAVLTNGYLAGFVQGKLYTGKLKQLCVPGLNCYSCPGSFGSCPIGSLQAVLGSAKYRFSFYLFGFFLVIGTILGRFICGFLCPFGLVQELLHKIPFPKKIATFRTDKPARYIKYVILAVFVILLPLFVVDAVGNGAPWFCKWICPVGTLEGGLPLVASNPMLQNAVGFLFAWKLVILAATLFASVLLYRPFCKYLCPLGAIYALFNRIAVYRYHVDAATCTGCRACERACPMQVKPQIEPNHPECIRCGACKEACAFGAITSGFGASCKGGACDSADKGLEHPET